MGNSNNIIKRNTISPIGRDVILNAKIEGLYETKLDKVNEGEAGIIKVYGVDSTGKQVMVTIPDSAIIDTEMSDTSTHPVQNKVIKHYVDEKDSNKIDLLGYVPGHESEKLPYNLPYFFTTDYNSDKVTVKSYTISLDNNKTQGVYSLDVVSATSEKAGLMNAHDKHLSDNIEKILRLVGEPIEPGHEEEHINLQIPYKFDIKFSDDNKHVIVEDYTVGLKEDYETGDEIKYRKYSITVPNATNLTPGLMSAEHVQDLEKKAYLPDELPPELKVPGVIYPWFMINLNPKGIDAEGNFKFEHSGYNLNTRQYYTWKDKSIPMAATTTTGGFMTAADKIELEKLREDKVDKEIVGTLGKAIIFNESDGGGAKFEGTNNINSFVGVHDGSGNNVKAQIYAIKKDNTQGTIIDVTENKAYYYKGEVKSASIRDVDDNEIAIKGDVDKKINLLGNESASGQPYHFPYHLGNLRFDKDDNKIKGDIYTITLDNNKTLTQYPIEMQMPALGLALIDEPNNKKYNIVIKIKADGNAYLVAEEE